MSARTDSPPLDFAGIRSDVEAVLDGFLADKTHVGAGGGRAIADEGAETLHAFLSGGGKRMRPILCAVGWCAGGGGPLPSKVLRVAGSLELFHAFALIHDDLMDCSSSRRGRPTVHRALSARYLPGRTAEAADRLGANAAMLIGDLALAWSDELLHTAGLTAGELARVLPVVDAMRTEVMHGQYLDLTSTGHPTPDVDRSLAISRYKTAKYTVERPLHIGAVLAGAEPPVLSALSAFALPAGEAFQLRDDLLGVYGDPAATGKPALDDLRDGKATALIALALQRASSAQISEVRPLLGCPTLTEAQAEVARDVISDTGARAQVEDMIHVRHEKAVQALRNADLPTEVVEYLTGIARLLVDRDQ
ncbi:polyprenyl synthetase family protein [Streptomyces sp. NPDC050610]|uniref:polyprenyl synthetase family protein n=1 Tax=Streptomyces sp. NPDC050610 TaxID=3157097 RepID=UPI0034368BFC